MSDLLLTFRSFNKVDTKWFAYLREEIGECEMKTSSKCTNTPDNVHHRDGDHSNNDLFNVEVVCHACHQRHHKHGVQFSVEHRRKISEANTGKTQPEYVKMKISATLSGRALADKHKMNIRLSKA